MYVTFSAYGCSFPSCLWFKYILYSITCSSLSMFAKKEISNFFIEMFYLKLPLPYYNKRITRVAKIKKTTRKYSISQCVDSTKLTTLSPKCLTHSDPLTQYSQSFVLLYMYVAHDSGFLMLQCLLSLSCGFSQWFHGMAYSYGFDWLHCELFTFCSKVCHLIKTSTESGQVIEICLLLYLNH